mgnify:CR=1 FL=1
MFTDNENVAPDALTLLEVGVPVTANEVGSTKTIVESPETPPDWPEHVYVFAAPPVNVNVFDDGDVDNETPWYCPDEGSDIETPLGVQLN